MSQTKTVGKLNASQIAFMNWLKANHPNLYAQSVQESPQLSGFMDSLANGFKSLMANSTQLLSQYVAGKSQIAQLKLNIERAKQGLAPITGNEPLAPVAPTGLAAVPMWVWIGGGGALLFLLLRK